MNPIKTKIEIIEETVAFYSEDVSRRASKQTTALVICAYKTKSGKMCAVGRCMLDPDKFKENNTSAYFLLEEAIIEILKPEYRGHEPIFWGKLQSLHDKEAYWQKDGLSGLGKTRVEELLSAYT